MFKFEYLTEFAAKLEKLALDSGVYLGLIDEKTRGRKSRAADPFNVYVYVYLLYINAFFSLPFSAMLRSRIHKDPELLAGTEPIISKKILDLEHSAISGSAIRTYFLDTAPALLTAAEVFKILQ
jgi:hypothetical protein